MRKNIIIVLCAIVLSGLLFSCQKVIDLKLNNASSQIVIQGNVYDQPGSDTVRISKSVNFDSTNVFPPVSGANVVISDNAGTSETLAEIYPGTYITTSLQGIPGRTYTLSVQTNGQTYTASSTMPSAVAIDSLSVQNSWFAKNKQISVVYTDPANITNYYRLIEFINQKQQPDFHAASDILTNGVKTTYEIFESDTTLVSGDKLTIWLESIDKNNYTYFHAASLNQRQSASPANPPSNITNGALGYFSACSVRKKSMIVP
jgi:hypothetical protein